jgi:long-chain acyl-CoA synthetase
VLDHLGELPAVTTVVQMIGRVEHELVISWADLEQRGADYLAINPTAVENVIASIQPEDLGTLIRNRT